jgi:fructose-1,6-bisphosphatase/inositol monophosphatase family enzyme
MAAHIEIMKQAALAAGKLILDNYGKVEFQIKKDTSFVSRVDTQAEAIIKRFC